jgi:hypothetical protein
VSTQTMCSWCHQTVALTEPPVWCPHCGHRADRPRVACDCPPCVEGRRRQAEALLGLPPSPPPARESEVGPPELFGLAEEVLAWLEREKHEHGGEGERLRRLLRDALTRAKGG